MTDFPMQTLCHYCKRELKEGEGRYRLLQKEDEVECCPPCFDATHAMPRYRLEEPAKERTDGQQVIVNFKKKGIATNTVRTAPRR